MDNKKIELTIKRKSRVVRRAIGIYKKIIPGQCVNNGLIDLVAAAKEAELEPDEFIVCYALLTSKVICPNINFGNESHYITAKGKEEIIKRIKKENGNDKT